MKLPIRLLVSGCMLVAAVNALGSDIKIIANPDVRATTLSLTELRGVFLLQRRTLNGSSVEPVLQKSGVVHDVFLQEFLNRSSEEMHTYYQGLVFTGKGSMPEELDSDAAVLAYVARTKGAIGYVSGKTQADGVKTLAVVPQRFDGSRTLLVRIEPEYPKELHQRRIQGTVRLRLTISPKGSVESVRVVGGNPILAEAAVKAVEQWVYSPSATASSLDVSIPFEVRP